jgi:hypothetical protein
VDGTIMLRAEVQLDRAAFLRAVSVVLLSGAIALLVGWLGWIVGPFTEHRRKSLRHEILLFRQDAGLVPELGTIGTACAMPADMLRTNHLSNLFTRLTTVKLALQLLQHRTDRCQDPEGLLDKALGATDDVISELRADAALDTADPVRAGATHTRS